ncbi:MAG: hypothetical protein GY947_16160 [Rhodobacteraceae bacterium]|nr:hypothetical protein [Paracoccaceae bacterium]
MKKLLCLVVLGGCAAGQGSYGPNPGEPSKLNFAYCEKIAAEVRDKGDLSNDLCPGYMPNGYPVEID